jgi:hypothetical protein
MALRNLLVRVGADLSGLQKGMKQAQSQMKGFAGKINGILAAIGTGLTLKGGIQDAMKFEALMGTLSTSLGDSMKDFVKWQNTVGASLGFSKVQSAELANTLSLNFKQIATSQKDLLDKTTKMMETAAVISSKRGMAMTEVSDRIRSAMNQEADGADELGVNVRVTAMQQSNAYKQMADGRPWAELSTNMQKAILYHHILESVSTNLGDTLQNNTQMKMSAFTASLADVRMALGSAFLPILNVVLPVLTAFMRKIEVAFQYVAAFTRALFGGGSALKQQKAQTAATNAQSAAVGGLGNAIKKTGKEAAKAAKASHGVAGFDEINQLADPASSGGGSGGGADTTGAEGGGSIPMPTPDPGPAEGAFGKISKKVQEFANKVKKFFAPVGEFYKKVWNEVSSYFKEKIEDLVKFWNKYGGQFLKALSNIWNGIKPIVTWIIKFIWNSIKGVIDGVIQFFKGLIKFISGVFTGDWKTAFSGIKDMVIGAVKAIWNFFNLTLFGGIKKGLLGLVKTVAKNWDDIIKATKSVWSKIPEFFKQTGSKMWEGITNFFKNAYTWFNTHVISKISSLFTNLKNFIEGRAELSWTSITNVFKGAATWFKTKVIDSITKHFNAWRVGVSQIASNVWEGIKKVFGNVYSWFKTNVADKISKALHTITSGVSDGFKGVVTAVINKGIGLINSLISKLNSALQYIDGHLLPGNAIPNIPQIPKLAKGGITNGPTLALIGDNPGGQEVVSPLDKLQDIVASAVGTAVMQAMQFSNKKSAGGDLIIQVDGTTMARVLNPYLEKENGRVGTKMIKR